MMMMMMMLMIIEYVSFLDPTNSRSNSFCLRSF